MHFYPNNTAFLSRLFPQNDLVDSLLEMELSLWIHYPTFMYDEYRGIASNQLSDKPELAMS